MKHFPFSLIPSIALVSAVPATGATAAAEVQALNAEALAAMESGKWEEALALLERCVSTHGDDALARFGPSFGVTWYRKGMCELQLKRWDAAAISFETCYGRFPNKNGDVTNLFNKRALLRWGEALQGGGKPADAIRLFRKFMEERDKKSDTFDPGSYYLLLALCHFQLGEVTEGAENFETAVRNKARFGSPESGVIAALQAFVTASVATKDEAALVAFLARNHDAVAQKPFEMEPYAGILVRMGTEAMGAGLDAAALALFELVPPSEKIAEDLRARLAEEGRTDKAALEASLARLEALRREGGAHDAIQWSAIAVIQERKGDPKASFAAYEQLELHFPKGPLREENLYHLARSASLAGNVEATENYGNRFLTTFPDSKHAPEIRQSMLTALFNQGSYDRCLAAAAALIPKLVEGTREHDVCLHLLGGSQHRGGHFAEAQPLLDRHATLYPESPVRQESLYLQAANLARLQRWNEAASLLDKIVAAPGANPFLAPALLERARVHAAAGEHAAAVEVLNRLEKEFPDSEVSASALMWKGNLVLEEGRRDDAKACYESTLALAEKQGDRAIAGEALYRLISLLGNSPQSKEALPFIDRFWKDHGADSPLRNRVAISQAAALDAADRDKEALERLQAVIAGSDPSEMQEAIGAYAAIYLRRHGAAALKEHFRQFPGLPADHPSSRAWLHIAAISVFESNLREAKDEAARTTAEGEIKALFEELKKAFAPKDLPSPVLLRTGDYLASKTSAPRQALPYYDEALARKDEAIRFPALLGRATILTTGNKDECAAALRDLETIFGESVQAREREDALFWMIATLTKTGDFKAAGSQAERYLAKDSGFTRYTPEVLLALARSFQERGMSREAVTTFKQLWSDPASTFEVAAPAMKTWLQLSWDLPVTTPEEKIDRRTICAEGSGFLERTRPQFDGMSAADQESWREIEKLVESYGTVLAAPAPAGQ